ncbi:hypothetical protein KIN20_015211 [Parelaphostrongylus tenuis]|uniref:mRNA-decapping enzyme 2 n=1 Tax=Parelaphostrongylus tenuis TaxID=148309 RepID=A0AAD5QSD0_PARTN|nr:hypothetical protein KIN20_015211 [Parelaphostrongylus tenuis]
MGPGADQPYRKRRVEHSTPSTFSPGRVAKMIRDILEYLMENISTPTTTKKNARRRVADSISKSPASPQSAQQSPATKLLAALNKAQGKSTQNTPTSTKQSQKSKADHSSTKQKPESGKKGGGAQHQNAQTHAGHGGECTSSINTRMSGSQASTKEAERPSTSRKVLKNTNQNQNHPPTASYSLWSLSPTKAPQAAPRIPPEVLQDLTFRFLANIPDEEKSDKVRMCFQVELAHWFYIDFYCKQEERKDCAQMGMREFARQIFKHCDELAPYAASVDQVIDEWRWYKSTVPTYGAILLDNSLNYVLLVQGFYASKNSWGFPKGKVNEGEEPRSCAVREVFEETGFNFDEHCHRGSEKKLQKFVNETMVRLYIVPDVPTDFPFAPQTRNEIRKIQWFNVWDLPTDRNDQSNRLRRLSSNNFYTVMPFIQDLQKYIVKEQEKRMVAAANDQKHLGQKSSSSVFGYLHSNSTLNPPTDISEVMDALFSGSAFAGTGYSGYEKSQSTKPSAPSLSEAIPLPASVVSNFNEQMVSTYSTQYAVHPPTTSRYCTSENVQNDPISHFRPLAHSPVGKTNPCARAESSSTAQRSYVGKELPHIAHPIAIPAQPALPLINRPVYVAPKERSSRISLSETSAFTAFKSPSQSSFMDTSPGAVDKIELELQKLLCTSSDREYYTIKANTSEDKTPTFLDSLSPDTDLGLEFAYMASLPRDEKYRNVGRYVQPRTHADGYTVQLCDAWKDFKLDRAAIFAGLPGFESAY